MNAFEFYSSLNVGDRFMDTRHTEIYEKVNEDYFIWLEVPEHQIEVYWIEKTDTLVQVDTGRSAS